MPPETPKRASWLELFYDLVYVALVAQLTYLTADHHHTLKDALNVFIVGYAIFIAWWATTANRNLQSSETSTDKLLVQLQMAGAFLLSLTMPVVFSGEYVGFFLTLALVRAAQIFMMLRMYRLHPSTAPQTYNILQGFAVAGVLWVVSAFVPDPHHFVVALCALAIDILAPLTKGKGNTIRLLNVHHLQERLGLFLMLVMGESMIVVALSNTATNLSFFEPTIVFSGLLMLCAIWWLYYEHHDAYGHGVRPRNFFVYLHSHGFLFGSIIVLSVAYKGLLKGDVGSTTFALCVLGVGGVVTTLLTMRGALYGVRVKACINMIVVIAVGAGIMLVCWHLGQLVLTMLILALFLALGALLDVRSGSKGRGEQIRA